MEVKGFQSGTIQINASEGAPLRDIIQINESEGVSGTQFRLRKWRGLKQGHNLE